MSAVVATMLLVAMTVVIAATVYVWVSKFRGDDDGDSLASFKVTTGSTADDGLDDFVRIVLIKSEENPLGYDGTPQGVLITVSAASGVYEINPPGLFCMVVPSGGGCPGDEFGPGGDTSWAQGESIYFPCQDAEEVTITITVKDAVQLETTAVCEQANP